MPKTTVFSQIIKNIPRSEFESIVSKYNADKGVRKLNSWTWFGSLLFSQLTGHDSIRALEKVFAHGDLEMRRLGFSSVCRSTLSDANSSRSLEVLEEVYNRKRLHSSLGYLPPEEFEEKTKKGYEQSTNNVSRTSFRL